MSPPAPEDAPVPVARFVRFSSDGPPGALCATLYTQGCPGRCPYCHSASLRAVRPGRMEWGTVESELAAWSGFVEMVVFSGGEPTLHPRLGAAMRRVRDLGFGVGLHTAGLFPGRLASVIRSVDWVGFDVKTRLDAAAYAGLLGLRDARTRVERSLAVLAASGVPHELRMTMAPGLVREEDARRADAALLDFGLAPVRRQRWQPASGLSVEIPY